MISLPQNSLTAFALIANGWVNAGISTPANTVFSFFTAVNKGANDVWVSFDQNNQQLLPAGGSLAVPVNVGGPTAAKLYVRNATDNSNGSGLSFCLYP